MSRIGKYPVDIPQGVTCAIEGTGVRAKGPKGENFLGLSEYVDLSLEGSKIWVKPRNDQNPAWTHWGTYRALVQNLIQGVAQGFAVNREIQGVGCRAALQGNTLKLQLGYSHDIDFEIPEGVHIKCEKPTAIQVSGVDRQKVGQVAANIMAFRKPDVYKGKGIRREGRYVHRKEGKKK